MQRIGYRHAVARQPECLEAGRKAFEAAVAGLDLAPFSGRSIGFAGIGASYQAALVGATYARSLGLRAYAYSPGDLYDTADSGAEAFVALSASGQSCEIAAVMRLRDGRPRLAICRGADNPLADITGRVIATESGADNGASSTGYTGMLQTIGLLVDRIAGRSATDWAALPGLVVGLLAEPAEHAAAAAARFAHSTSIDIVGAGTGFATAGEAAMLIREAVRIPAAGWDTLNYLHGPMESQDRTTGLIVLGEGREVKIATDVAGFGCPTVLVTSRPGLAAIDTLSVIDVPRAENIVIDAIVKIVAVQRVVGEMQDAAGLTDTTFRYRQTDTKLKPWSPTEV